MKKHKLINSLLIQFSGIFFSILNRIIFSNYLTENEFGIYNFLILLPSMLALVFNFGLGHAISLDVAKHKNHWRGTFKFILFYSFLVGIVSFIIGFIGIASFYHSIDTLLIVMSCLSTSFFIFNYLVSFYFLGIEKTTTYFLLTNLIHIISLILFLLMGNSIIFNINIALASFVFSNIIIFFISNILVYKEMQQNKIITKIPFNRGLIKNLFKLGFPMYSAALINFFNYRLDSFIIAKMLPFTYLGNYALAVLIIDAVGKISQTFSLFLFSKLPKSNDKDSEKITYKYSLIVLIFNSVAAFGIIVILEFVLKIAFSNKYEFVYWTTLLLLPGMIFIGQFRIYYHALASKGEGKKGTRATMLSFVFTVILDLILIPKFHIYGAAIASSIAYGISLIYILLMYKSYNKGKGL